MGRKYLHTLCSSGEVHSHTSTPDAVSSVFQFCIIPDHPARCQQMPMNVDPYFWPTLWSRYSRQLNVPLEILPNEVFPSPVFFRSTPGCGCGTAAIQFQLVPAYHSEPSLNQAQIFLSYRNFQCIHRGKREKRQCSRRWNQTHKTYYFL